MNINRLRKAVEKTLGTRRFELEIAEKLWVKIYSLTRRVEEGDHEVELGRVLSFWPYWVFLTPAGKSYRRRMKKAD